MKRGAASLAGMILLVASPFLLLGGERVETRVGVPSKRAGDVNFPLPPNARVQRETQGGQQGVVPLSVRPAADHWEKRLVAEGWRLTGRETLPGSRAGLHSSWRHEGHQKEATLLLVANAPGDTLFLWFFTPDDK